MNGDAHLPLRTTDHATPAHRSKHDERKAECCVCMEHFNSDSESIQQGNALSSNERELI